MLLSIPAAAAKVIFFSSKPLCSNSKNKIKKFKKLNYLTKFRQYSRINLNHFNIIVECSVFFFFFFSFGVSIELWMD